MITIQYMNGEKMVIFYGLMGYNGGYDELEFNGHFPNKGV